MKRCLELLVVLVLMSGCTTQRLTITNGKLPDSLGVHLVNNANISNDDWKYFTSATDNFISKYNSSKHKFKLYPTQLDSNSVKIDITKNKYATKTQQVLGVIYIVSGIVLPIWLIAEQDQVIIKNRTRLSKSLSSDLNASNNASPILIQTSHHFESLEKQKEKQKRAYTTFLSELFHEIDLGKSPSYTNHSFDNLSRATPNDEYVKLRGCENYTIPQINTILQQQTLDTVTYYKNVIDKLNKCNGIYEIYMSKTKKSKGLTVLHNYDKESTNNHFKVGYWIYYKKDGEIKEEVMYDIFENVIFKKKH